jgi:hypothetical protein
MADFDIIVLDTVTKYYAMQTSYRRLYVNVLSNSLCQINCLASD